MKFVFKAEFTPSHVDKALFIVAPMAIFAAAVAVFAVVPFGSVIPPDVFPASWGIQEPIRLVVAPGIDVGMIYVFAVGSIAVYGVVLGGWASNNKYSFLGGHAEQRPVDLLRAAAGPGHPRRGAGEPARCGSIRSSPSRPKPACGTC